MTLAEQTASLEADGRSAVRDVSIILYKSKIPIRRLRMILEPFLIHLIPVRVFRPY